LKSTLKTGIKMMTPTSILKKFSFSKTKRKGTTNNHINENLRNKPRRKLFNK